MRATVVTEHRFGYFGIRARHLPRDSPSAVTLEPKFHVPPANGYFLSIGAFTGSKPTLTSLSDRVEQQAMIPFISILYIVFYKSAITVLCLDIGVF